ncbi:MAG: ATP-binding protein [Pseudomonadota bacterium]
MDLEKYRKIFIQESGKYLDELDTVLIQVEKDILNQQLWGQIHGKIHSIKGMAKALSIDKISELSHSMEAWCKQFQGGHTKPTDYAVQLLIDGAALLKKLVAGKPDVISPENLEWWNRLIAKFAKSPDELVNDLTPEARPVSSPEKIDRIRVDYSLIEELLARSQEIILLEKSLPPLSHDQISAGLRTWIDRYMSMLRGLHFQLARLRLIPVDDFVHLFGKTVRDLAKTYNRDVRLEVVGGELQVDIGLMDRLREPFMHLLRNAIAHGIESPDERAKAGKNREGKIVLEADRLGDSLVLKVSDDGRGIDRAAITKYLKDNRSISDEEISLMSDEEVLNTILRVDFSSAQETTQLAGRGIGMNVIARAIGYLSGSMTIRSEISKGTQFTIKLPLSLSIVYAIVFKLGGYALSVPTSHVESIERPGAILPEERESFYDLKSFLKIDTKGKMPSHILKLRQPAKLEKSDSRSGHVRVAVDSIVGNIPLMVMPLGELLAKANTFAGVGVMENGDISILLAMEKL